VIVSAPGLVVSASALVIACRSEPNPLSAVVVTRNGLDTVAPLEKIEVSLAAGGVAVDGEVAVAMIVWPTGTETARLAVKDNMPLAGS